VAEANRTALSERGGIRAVQGHTNGVLVGEELVPHVPASGIPVRVAELLRSGSRLSGEAFGLPPNTLLRLGRADRDEAARESVRKGQLVEVVQETWPRSQWEVRDPDHTKRHPTDNRLEAAP